MILLICCIESLYCIYIVYCVFVWEVNFYLIDYKEIVGVVFRFLDYIEVINFLFFSNDCDSLYELIEY